MSLVEGSSEMGPFRHFCTCFKVRIFITTLAMRLIFFFQDVQNLIYISKMEKTNQKKISLF